MADTEYEEAWRDGEPVEAAPTVDAEGLQDEKPVDGPATAAVKKTAQESRDAQAKEFAEAFFADEASN